MGLRQMQERSFDELLETHRASIQASKASRGTMEPFEMKGGNQSDDMD